MADKLRRFMAMRLIQYDASSKYNASVNKAVLKNISLHVSLIKMGMLKNKQRVCELCIT